jgi:hypothetical protein
MGRSAMSITPQLDGPDFYWHMVGLVRNLDPDAEVPPQGFGAASKLQVMLERLQANPPTGPKPVPQPLTQGQRDWIASNTLQSEIASVLADYANQGIVERKDFPFPDENAPNRLGKLQGMKARLERAHALHHMPVEARFKLLQAEFEAFKAEVVLRFGEIEQELSRT